MEIVFCSVKIMQHINLFSKYEFLLKHTKLYAQNTHFSKHKLLCRCRLYVQLGRCSRHSLLKAPRRPPAAGRRGGDCGARAGHVNATPQLSGTNSRAGTQALQLHNSSFKQFYTLYTISVHNLQKCVQFKAAIYNTYIDNHLNIYT